MNLDLVIEALEGEYCELRHQELSGEVIQKFRTLVKKCRFVLKNIKANTTTKSQLGEEYTNSNKAEIYSIMQRTKSYLAQMNQDRNAEVVRVYR